MEKNVLYAGQKIELQNMTLEIPPLNFKALKNGALKKMQNIMDAFMEMQKQIDAGKITVDIPVEVIDDAIQLVHMAAKRNYPELTVDEVEEGMDMEILQRILPVLMSQNPPIADPNTVAPKEALK